jgi:hypothetical protein
MECDSVFITGKTHSTRPSRRTAPNHCAQTVTRMPDLTTGRIDAAVWAWTGIHSSVLSSRNSHSSW